VNDDTPLGVPGTRSTDQVDLVDQVEYRWSANSSTGGFGPIAWSGDGPIATPEWLNQLVRHPSDHTTSGPSASVVHVCLRANGGPRAAVLFRYADWPSAYPQATGGIALPQADGYGAWAPSASGSDPYGGPAIETGVVPTGGIPLPVGGARHSAGRQGLVTRALLGPSQMLAPSTALRLLLSGTGPAVTPTVGEAAFGQRLPRIGGQDLTAPVDEASQAVARRSEEYRVFQSRFLEAALERPWERVWVNLPPDALSRGWQHPEVDLALLDSFILLEVLLDGLDGGPGNVPGWACSLSSHEQPTSSKEQGHLPRFVFCAVGPGGLRSRPSGRWLDLTREYPRRNDRRTDEGVDRLVDHLAAHGPYETARNVRARCRPGTLDERLRGLEQLVGHWYPNDARFPEEGGRHGAELSQQRDSTVRGEWRSRSPRKSSSARSRSHWNRLRPEELMDKLARTPGFLIGFGVGVLVTGICFLALSVLSGHSHSTPGGTVTVTVTSSVPNVPRVPDTTSVPNEPSEPSDLALPSE
jgi:hypothetical protein